MPLNITVEADARQRVFVWCKRVQQRGAVATSSPRARFTFTLSNIEIASSMFGRAASIISDPMFGVVKQDKHGWAGPGCLAFDGEIPWVRIDRSTVPPTETDRTAYEAASSIYTSLTSKLQAALFALWGPELSESHWVDPPRTGEALWSMVLLEGVTVRVDGMVDLHYGFRNDFWPDATFTIRIDGTEVVPRSLDD